MPPGTPDEVVDRREAAKLLKCSNWQIFQLTNDGRLPSFRVGRLVRIRRADIEEFMAAGGCGTKDAPDAVDAWVERTLATAPPLTDEQRTKLAELLGPVRKAGGARD
jgi:excisionase family DNA binding protein